MSIADHFDHTPEAGFVRSYDSAAARRQFQVSLILIVLLAGAAMALGMVIRFDDPHAATQVTPASVMQPAPARTHGATGGQEFAFEGVVFPALRS